LLSELDIGPTRDLPRVPGPGG